jgi:hypothetical protein
VPASRQNHELCVTLTVPNNPALRGLTLYFALVVAHGNMLEVSDQLKVVIQQRPAAGRLAPGRSSARRPRARGPFERQHAAHGSEYLHERGLAAAAPCGSRTGALSCQASGLSA